MPLGPRTNMRPATLIADVIGVVRTVSLPAGRDMETDRNKTQIKCALHALGA